MPNVDSHLKFKIWTDSTDARASEQYFEIESNTCFATNQKSFDFAIFTVEFTDAIVGAPQ